MQPHHAGRRALILGAGAGLAGCALTPFGRLERNLEQLDQLAALHGQVVDAQGHETAAAIVALHQTAGTWRVENAVSAQGGRFVLRVQPGVAYRVLAIADPGGTRRPTAEAARAVEASWTAAPNGQGASRTLFLRAGSEQADESIQVAVRHLVDAPINPLPVSLGRVTTLDHAMFDASVASLGFWAPLDFLASVGGGVYLLQPHASARLPVLVVHGAAGSPRDLAAVIGALDTARVEPWVFHYPSGLRLDAVATMLTGILADLVPRLGMHRLAIVAHSMGGLVSLAAIRQLAQRMPSLRVPLLASVASPWGGHGAAGWGVKLAPTPIPSWIDMRPGSTFLQTLQAAPLATGLKHNLYFAFRGRGDDGTVTLASQLEPAVQARATRVRGFDADHMSVLSEPGLLRELRTATAAAAG